MFNPLHITANQNVSVLALNRHINASFHLNLKKSENEKKQKTSTHVQEGGAGPTLALSSNQSDYRKQLCVSQECERLNVKACPACVSGLCFYTPQ